MGTGLSGAADGTNGLRRHLERRRGAGPRPEGTTGLAEVELLATPEAAAEIAGRLGVKPAERMEARDPWGTRLTIRTA